MSGRGERAARRAPVRLLGAAAALAALTLGAEAATPSALAECALRTDIVRDYIPSGRNAEALDLLTARIEAGGKDSCSDFDLYSLRAKILEFQGDWEGSLRDLDAAVKLEPRDPWILQRRCFVFGVLGRMASARIDCGKSLSAARRLEDPLIFAGAANTMAGVLAQFGDLDQAFAALDEAMAQISAAEIGGSPERNEFAHQMRQKLLSTRALILVSYGDAGQAIDALNTAIAAAPADTAVSDSVLDLREARYRLNLDQFWYVEAIADLRVLIAQRQGRADLLNDLCWSLAMVGAAGEAIANCEAGLKIKPDDFATLDSYGLALTKAGRFDEAIGVLKKALAIEPENGWALVHLAQAFKGAAQLSDYRETVAELQKIVDNWPMLRRDIDELARDN